MTPSPKPTPQQLAWRPIAVAAGVIAAAAVGLWQLGRPSPALRLAIINWPAYEYFYLAEEKGLSRPLDLNLQVAQYSSLLDQRQAFERGDVQAIATTIPEALAICHERPARCPQLILVLDQSDGADRILARAPISTPQQLLGKRVGLERAVLAEYLLTRSLGDQPRDLAREMRLHFDVPDGLVAGLKAGELDAVVTYHPYDTRLRQDPAIREVFSSRQIPGEIVDVLAVDPAYARAHPGEVRALVQTWWAARAYARRAPTEAAAVMAQRQQLDPEQFQLSERGLLYPTAAQQQQLLARDGSISRTLQRVAALMRRSGGITYGSPLPQVTAQFLGSP
ncbi:MAG: ABC transporter substrate-binding protein [Vulcanococcus sp.]